MVPFASYVSRGQSKPRLIFSRINGPIVNVILKDGIRMFLNTLTIKIEANCKITTFFVLEL